MFKGRWTSLLLAGLLLFAMPQPAFPSQALTSGSLIGAAETVVIDALGQSSVGVQITGTWTATASFEGTIDNITWFAVTAYPIPSGASVTSAAANGQWLISSGGLRNVRVRASAYTSGTIVVWLSSALARSPSAMPSYLNFPTGTVLNFGGGDFTLTHASKQLAFATTAGAGDADGKVYLSNIVTGSTDPAAAAEVTAFSSAYNRSSATNANMIGNAIEGVYRAQAADESSTGRGLYGRFYIAPGATLRTGIGVEASARASYSGGTEIGAESGTAFVGARIWMAPYFSAASVNNVNNFWGLWIYGEHATQRNADSAIKISSAGGGFTNDITFQNGMTLAGGSGSLTLAGGSLVAPTIYGGIAANDDITIAGTSHGTTATSYVILQPSGGNVGIGTTAPVGRLHVEGSIISRATNPAVALYTDSGSGTEDGFDFVGGANLNIREVVAGAATSRLYIQQSGNVIIGAADGPQRLSVIGGSLAVGSYTDASNYEYGKLTQAAGTLTLSAETLGTGTDNIDIILTPAGTGAVDLGSTVAAGASAGALLNSPVAGNATIYLRVKSGASYYAVPAWVLP